jgi:hypothetical protein
LDPSSFNKLEARKAAVLARLESWPSEQLAFRPNSTAWTALDVVSHLVKVEAAFIGRVKDSLADGKIVTIREQCMALVVIGVMRSPARVKVPAGASGVLPEPSASLAELAAEWSAVRANIRLLLDSIPPNQMNQGFFKHPVSGWMSIPMALRFLSAHLRHHEYQLKRLWGALEGRKSRNVSVSW